MALRLKYLEEHFPEYFIFGSKVGNPELVNVSNGIWFVASGIPKSDALRLIRDRKVLLDLIFEEAIADDTFFNRLMAI